MYKNILLALIACLGSTSFASAQVGLGTPVTPETYGDTPGGMSARPVVVGGPEWKTAPRHPVLASIRRVLMAPIRAASAHLMPPRIEEAPTPTRDDVARMVTDGNHSPAEIWAAKVKIDESQARARRAAVKYLATVDCNYYPEAESGLIAALRADRVESVRHEAAVALGNTPTLSNKMLEALNMTALAVELDGNPPETSERVRSAARQSLDRCVIRGLCLPPAAQPIAPTLGFLAPDPYHLQPVAYHQPMYAPTMLPVTQKERQVAETVSTPAKVKTSWIESRPLYHFLHNFTSSRDSNRGSQNEIDPRLRGLAPLGSDASLGIPTAPATRPSLAPLQPYNYRD